MILLILILLTVTTFFSWFFIKKLMLRNILGTISILLLALTSVLIAFYLGSHFGMRQETEVSKPKVIFSAVNQRDTNILVANEIGSNSHNYVFVYRDKNSDQKSTTHFVPNQSQIVTAVKKRATYRTGNVDQTTIVTRRKTWVFRNQFYRALFDVSGTPQLIRQTTTIIVPKSTWVVVNASQAKKLAQMQSRTNNDANTQQEQAALQAQIAAYEQQNPNETAQQIQQYADTLQAKAIATQIRQRLGL